MFRRIDDAIRTCDRHLGSINLDASEVVAIEAFLVSALVLVIVSEYEEIIEKSFMRRAEACGDNHVANYVRSQIAQKFWSPKVSKINETLGRFGSDYRETFEKAVTNTGGHAAWDNILVARHAVVHKTGALNLTLRELKESYEKSQDVFTALFNVLGLAMP